MTRSFKLQAMGAASVLAVTLASASAMAGGVAIREQSTNFQGSSFAGAAAGGALSSVFWNPAALSEAKPGFNTESSNSLIFGSSEVTARTGTQFPNVATGGATGAAAPAAFLNNADDIGRPALVGAMYASYRLSEDVVFGLAVNSPFGLSTEGDTNSGSQYHGRSGSILTVNVNPMLSFNLGNGVSVGVGGQVQYGRINFKAASSPFPGANGTGFDVDDIAFGGNAGILWKPVAGTSIGLGYRSPIHHDFEGSVFANDGSLLFPTRGGPVNLGFTKTGIEGGLTLPEIVTLSFRQAMTPDTRLLGSVEWTHWGRLGTFNLKTTGPGGFVPAPFVAGQTASSFVFNWHDGWMFSVGGEYDYSPNLTLRAGVAYEISPIQNANERFSLITDSDRIWLSGGGTYKWSDTVSFDFAYTHIFFDDAQINRAFTSSLRPYALIADVQTSVDIVSLGLKVSF